jgi:hypothetical protein
MATSETVARCRLIEQVLAAHGGRARWRSVDAIEATLHSGGLAFTSRLQPFALRNQLVTVRPHVRRVTFAGFGRPGWRGLWTPDYVRIEDQTGSPVDERHDPRRAFARLDRRLRWDRLDLLYFAGYALWNYLSFPFLLLEPGVTVDTAPDEVGGRWRRLVARFDTSVPTHSPVQTLHIDTAGFLVRHDYTAEVFGAWASAANVCLASSEAGGLRFYTRRRVYPRLGRWALPAPTLVWIHLDNLRLLPAAALANTPLRKANHDLT